MQRQYTPPTLSALPVDALLIILSILELPEFLRLRLVSKQFNRVVNAALSRPENVLEMFGKLNHYPVRIQRFINYYKNPNNSDAYEKLKNKSDLNPVEKICFALLARTEVSNYICIFEHTLRDSIYSRSPEDIIYILNHASPFICRLYSNYLIQFLPSDWDKYKKTIEIEIDSLATLQHENDRKRIETLLLEFICVALICDLAKLDPAKIMQVIEILNTQFYYHSHADFQHCVASLNCSMAAMKKDKTEDDWAILRRGAKVRVNLSHAVLSHRDLSDANLENAWMNDAILQNADLTGATLSGAELSLTSFRGANLSRANLQKARMFGCNFQGAVLTQANLTEGQISNATFNGAILTGAKFAGIKITREIFLQNPTQISTVANLTGSAWFDKSNFTPENLYDLSYVLERVNAFICDSPNIAALQCLIAMDLIRKLPANDTGHSEQVLKIALGSPLFHTRYMNAPSVPIRRGLFAPSVTERGARQILLEEKIRLLALKNSENSQLSSQSLTRG